MTELHTFTGSSRFITVAAGALILFGAASVTQAQY
jgi:hypothetical protein